MLALFVLYNAIGTALCRSPLYISCIIGRSFVSYYCWPAAALSEPFSELVRQDLYNFRLVRPLLPYSLVVWRMLFSPEKVLAGTAIQSLGVGGSFSPSLKLFKLGAPAP